MPTYDYICVACANEFEEYQKMSDPLIEFCPMCGGEVKRKIGSGGGLLFKGKGFYSTDYKKEGEKPKKDVVEKTKTKEPSINENNGSNKKV